MVRILALSDFSANAHSALRVAMQVAQLYGGEVIFTHVMARSPVPAAAPQDLFSELAVSDQARWEDRLREEVQRLYRELGIRHREVLYRVKAVPAPFTEAVVHLSEQHSVDLVLMGSTGTSGLQRILLGSNTLQIVKRTTKPLLVIPRGFILAGFTSISLIIRPERFKYRSGIGLLLRIARSYGAALNFLFVLDGGSRVQDADDLLAGLSLFQEVQGFPCSVYTIPGAARRSALQEHVQETKADLLVTFPSTKSLWEELFADSMTEEIADWGKIPLLVFPADRQPKHQG